MGAVALQTAFFNRIVVVRGDKAAGLHLMAGDAEGVGLLLQKGCVLGSMGIMAGHAALIHGGMDKFFLELCLIMAGIAGCLGLFFEQSRIGAVMRGVAAVASPLTRRIMGGFIQQLDPKFLVTCIAEFRLFLTKEQAADKTMGQVTG